MVLLRERKRETVRCRQSVNSILRRIVSCSQLAINRDDFQKELAQEAREGEAKTV